MNRLLLVAAHKALCYLTRLAIWGQDGKRLTVGQQPIAFTEI